jgi:hypothetical protein
VQVRLPGFDLDTLCRVGHKVCKIYGEQAADTHHLREVIDDSYIADLAKAVTGALGGKVGIAPRIFLKKLVGGILDRVDQFADFDPRKHYALTVNDTELTTVERASRAATSVDDIELQL